MEQDLSLQCGSAMKKLGVVVLACHGRKHEQHLPDELNPSLQIDWDKAILVDMDPFSQPDIKADLSSKAALTLFPPSTVDLLLPIYCNFHVYGKWNSPNRIFFESATLWLRPGGRLVIIMPEDGLALKAPRGGKLATTKFKKVLSHLPAKAIDTQLNLIITAYLAETTAAGRRRVSLEVTSRFAGCQQALAALSSSIFAAQASDIKQAEEHMSVFAEKVQDLTRGGLQRVSAPDLVRKSAGPECMVFSR